MVWLSNFPLPPRLVCEKKRRREYGGGEREEKRGRKNRKLELVCLETCFHERILKQSLLFSIAFPPCVCYYRLTYFNCVEGILVIPIIWGTSTSGIFIVPESLGSLCPLRSLETINIRSIEGLRIIGLIRMHRRQKGYGLSRNAATLHTLITLINLIA